MEQTTRQTNTSNTEPGSHTAKRVVGSIFGIIEIILAFRFFFKLLGANPDNGFVKVIYDITQGFVSLFAGIFSNANNTGAETTSIFEPGTLIAILIVAIIGWIIMKLLTRNSGNSTKSSVTIEEINQGK
jgi:hypothetical protein